MINTAENEIKRCGCCGRITEKFWRRYNNMSFCATCYSREFKHKPCGSCGTKMRAHIKDKHPCCTNCSRSKPCVRCGKTTDEIGKITQYGNVCKSCSVYFREPRACANCGKVTTRLSKKESLGFYEPVCNQCFTMDHASCQACGRHRKLNQTDNGKLVCSLCLTKGEKLCSQCNTPMPAGHGKICRSCYYKNLLNKRTQTCIEALGKQFYVGLFEEFSVWLEGDTGTHKAAITINKHFPFFYGLNTFYLNGIPDYCELLKLPEVFNLRTNSLPVRFLCSTDRLAVDLAAKNNEMNRQTIQRYLQQKTGIVNLDRLLINYHQHLVNKQTTPRSIRLAMTPAVKLLSLTSLVKKDRLDQAILNKFLNSTHGQYAAIYGFVVFCKDAGERIEMPHRTTITKSKSRLELERTLIGYIKRGDNIFSNAKFRAVALAYFHKMELHTAKHIVAHSPLQKIDKHLFSLSFKTQTYLIPTNGVDTNYCEELNISSSSQGKPHK